MPSAAFTTNVPIDDPKAFALEFSKFSADTLGKPEDYITVNISQNPTLTFKGTFEPAFLLHITSLDNIDPEKNDKYSKAFFAFFEKKFGIPGDRGYITFYDPGRAYLGYQGTTFATIFASK